MKFRPVKFGPVVIQSVTLFWLLLLLGGCSAVSGGQPLRFPYQQDGNNSLNSRYDEVQPQVSGRYIALVSDRRGSQELYLFDLRDRRLLPLPGIGRLGNLASHPSVSEDGQWLVFTASQGGRSALFLYRRDRAQVRSLVSGLNSEVRNPSISANGERIAFELSRNGQWDIAVVDRQGRFLGVR